MGPRHKSTTKQGSDCRDCCVTTNSFLVRQSRDKRVFSGLPAVRDATDGERRRKENKLSACVCVCVKCPGIRDQELGIWGGGEWGIDRKLERGQSALVSHYQGSEVITEQTQARANYLARVSAYVPRRERPGGRERARDCARKGNKRAVGGEDGLCVCLRERRTERERGQGRGTLWESFKEKSGHTWPLIWISRDE